jgi:DNA-directed RNA polymerase specialized sigma subunit
MTMQNDLDYDELYENLKEELGREPSEDEINERFENSSN